MPKPPRIPTPAWLLLAACAGNALASPPAPTAPDRAHAVAPTLAEPFRDALEAVMRTPGGTPAMAVAIVQGDARPWIAVQGRVRDGFDAPADADTRFYIASQTKSFLGLLAAVLDADGRFPLSTTLAEVWPDLRLPAPADPRRITMADLLSHQEGLSTDTLNLVTAYVRDVPAADYPALLSTDVAARPAGFRYANLGDLVYGAALEARTGRHWRDWLEDTVLRPLALDGVSPRPSTQRAAPLAWNHQWDGARWHALRPKPDALMHAAGGLVASPTAMARWMQANLDAGGAGAALPARAWRRSQQPVARSRLADGEIDCHGYSLGWYRCAYRGQQALMHPGSYEGTVSVTVLVPSAGAGLSLLASSDSAMEGLQLEWMKAFIGLATGLPGEGDRLRKSLAAYPARVAGKAADRLGAIAAEQADPRWGGWRWHPDVRALDACTGTFDNRLYGPLQVVRDARGLAARAGALDLRLQPARPGLFAATTASLEPPEPLRCDTDGGSIEWRGQVFRKRRAPAPQNPQKQ